jgi:DNA (cytosine-5)-methyltransferase 1
MLKPHELYAAQGFPSRYIIAPEYKGKPLTQKAQVKMCGNSVPPVCAEALVRANYVEIGKMEKRA